MKITGLKLRSVSGVKEFNVGGNFTKSRQVRPLDIYPEYQATYKKYGEDFRSFETIDDKHIRLTHIFLQIETDDGVIGMSGPVTMEIAYFISTYLKPLLIGLDPIASEKIWDIMHRAMVRGSSADAIFAISHIDNALWDLKGRWLGQPVYRLIGGPTRPSVPAYSSFPDVNTDDMDFVREHALKQIELGFKAQKWFFHYGPGSGSEGVKRNVELVRTVRETVGEDYVLMFDAWQSWTVPYAIDMLERISEYSPFWVEECAMIDRFDSYKRIKDKSPLRLSGGEHAFSRWDIKRYIDQGALDVLQPDMTWSGGLSELLKIGALCSVYDVLLIPHSGATPVLVHWSLAQPPVQTPYQEFGNWEIELQHFLIKRVLPTDGAYYPNNSPGTGVDVNLEIVDKEDELFKN